MILKLVKIQVRLLHAYQNKRPEGFAATSLDEIKILNNSQEAGFRYSLILHGLEHKNRMGREMEA